MKNILVPMLVVSALYALPALAFGPDEGFSKVDANQDGKITLEEIQAFRQARTESMDANKDGQISEQEMHDAMMKQAEEHVNRAVRMRFAAQDANDDHLLSKDEQASENRVEDIFARVDANHDGAITHDELDSGREKMHGPHGRPMMMLLGLDDKPE